MKLRLDKFLCDMGIGTRSEIKAYCKNGMVRVNSAIVRDSGFKILVPGDNVFFREQEVEYTEYEYYLLNKPAGVLSATNDKHQPTVVDLIKDAKRKDLFPVGRLDKDTEGLLIITNDGLMAHDLLSPRKHVEKTYYVETTGTLNAKHCELVAKGIQLDEDFLTKPGRLDILESGTVSKALITISEGKFHQIKRMMEAMDNEVTYLKRLKMGPLTLPEDLAVGEYRRLSSQEIRALKGLGDV